MIIKNELDTSSKTFLSFLLRNQDKHICVFFINQVSVTINGKLYRTVGNISIDDIIKDEILYVGDLVGGIKNNNNNNKTQINTQIQYQNNTSLLIKTRMKIIIKMFKINNINL